MGHWGYPAARPEARGDGTPAIGPRYEQIETSGLFTCQDTDLRIMQFSGRPDAIDFAATTNPAIFTLQDEMGVTLGSFLVPSLGTYSSQISCNRVLVRNAIALGVAIASVTGKWAKNRVERPALQTQRAAVGP